MFEAALDALEFEIDLDGVDDAACLAAIRELEQVKCVAEARQAELTAWLAQGREARDVAMEVAIARRESPHRGRLHVGLAEALATDLPHTMAALRSGRVTEWRATLIDRETSSLTPDDRRRIDEQLAGDADALEQMGDRQVASAARRLAAELDPASFVARRRQAESARHVSLRPAPDTMSYLTALVPVEQGVSMYAALLRAADSARATGDPRGKGQVMADALVQRVTGQQAADDVPVAVNLVISDQALLGESDDPGHRDGHEPFPADLARRWISGASRATLRRVYASPESGQLVAMESRSRTFPKGLSDLIRFRDQTCRTPWCDAPIRHIDHVRAAASGGPTSFANGQGTCEACNQAKGSDPWTHRTGLPPPGPRPWTLTDQPQQEASISSSARTSLASTASRQRALASIQRSA